MRTELKPWRNPPGLLTYTCGIAPYLNAFKGKTHQVILGFEVSVGRFLSYDRGINPETGQALWGALMGPYEFSKCGDWAGELPLD